MARDQGLPHDIAIGGCQLGDTASNQLLTVSLIGQGQPLDQTRLMGDCVRGNRLVGGWGPQRHIYFLCRLMTPSDKGLKLIFVGNGEDAEGNGRGEV